MLFDKKMFSDQNCVKKQKITKISKRNNERNVEKSRKEKNKTKGRQSKTKYQRNLLK